MGVIVSELATSISEFTLTSRGKESFELALDGKMISEISKLLCISFSGVLRHREKILEENACHSMNKLIAKYYGLFSDSSSLRDILQGKVYAHGKTDCYVTTPEELLPLITEAVVPQSISNQLIFMIIITKIAYT